MDLDLWDFAGQHLYYTFCPVFFAWRAIYLLVYNLSKELNEIAMPCFRRGFLNIPLENTNRQTNLFLLSWLVTLSSVCTSKPEANEKTPSESDLLYTRPPVFIVGTHADRKQDQDVKEMELQITKENFWKRLRKSRDPPLLFSRQYARIFWWGGRCTSEKNYRSFEERTIYGGGDTPKVRLFSVKSTTE